jgi:long-chain fatty acid transport protein
MRTIRRDVPGICQRQRPGKPTAQAREIAVCLLVLCGWTCGLPKAHALGFRVPNQDPSAIARGNAFAATADNPSAIYYNPAGITQLGGQNAQIGSLFYLGIYADYTSPTGQQVDNNPEVIPAPTLQYTITPKDSPVSFGFGVYEPFGFSVDWPNDAPFRQESLKGSLTYITMNPIVAWRILPSLSVGAGPTLNYSQINIVQGILPANSPFTSFFPDDQSQFKGDNWSFGYNVGLLWQPHPQWSFGASYRSGSRMNYQGDFKLQDLPPTGQTLSASGASSSIDFPQIAIGGVSYRPTPNWNIEFDLDWADWTSVKDLAIQGAPVPVPSRRLDWQSSFMYEIGVTRYFDNGYYLSAGYFFSQASTPSDSFTPMVPDTDLHVGSIGGGYKAHNWSLALAFQVIGGDWRNVSVDPSAGPTASIGSGSYRLFTPTVSFAVGYAF